MKILRKFQSSADAAGVTFAVLFIVLLGAILLPLPRSFQMPDRDVHLPPAGNLQEELGYRFTTLALSDLEWQRGLRAEWDKLVRQINILENGRPGVLQEHLGQAIVLTAQAVWMMQEQLRAGVAESREALGRFHAEKQARRQEQLGQAVVAAYRQTSGIGPAFQAAFERAANRHAKIEQRVGRRLEDTLAVLSARQDRFPETAALMYDEAVQSARRSARMMHESRLTWDRRGLDDIQSLLARERTPEQYLSLAESARAIFNGPGVVTGYVEFGMPALAGLLAIMAWLVLSINLDPLVQPRSAQGPKDFETELHPNPFRSKMAVVA